LHAGGLPALERGKLVKVRDGTSSVAFIATGSMVKTACQVAEESGAAVWSAPWIRPLDEAQLLALASGHTALVTFEEHSASAGLGSAVMETIGEAHPIPVLRIGIGDRFSITCGSHAHAMKEHGLDLATVRARVLPFARQWARP
jgi:transketolase